MPLHPDSFNRLQKFAQATQKLDELVINLDLDGIEYAIDAAEAAGIESGWLSVPWYIPGASTVEEAAAILLQYEQLYTDGLDLDLEGLKSGRPMSIHEFKLEYCQEYDEESYNDDSGDFFNPNPKLAQEIREPQQGEGPGNPGGLRITEQWANKDDQVSGLSKYSNGAYAAWNSDSDVVMVFDPFGNSIGQFSILEPQQDEPDQQAYHDAFVRDHDAMMEYLQELPDELRTRFGVGSY